MQVEFEDGYHDHEVKPETADTSAAEAALKAKLSRKRTKTGCLTCRKRRIKCGEQRPVCSNCVKSKRHCEGYSQRVVFKPPTFEYQPVANGSAHITFQAAPPPDAVPQHVIQFSASDSSSYTQLLPRPAYNQFVTVWDQHSQQYVHVPAPAPEPEPEQKQYTTTGLQHIQPQSSGGPMSVGHVMQNPFAVHHRPQSPTEHSSSHTNLHAVSSSLDPTSQLSRPGFREWRHGGLPPTNGLTDVSVSAATDSFPHMYSHPVMQPPQHVQVPKAPVMGPQNPWTDSPSEAGADVRGATQTPVSATLTSTLAHSQPSVDATPHSQWQTDWQIPDYESIDHGQQPQHDQYYQHHHINNEIQTPLVGPNPGRSRTPEFYEHEIHAPPTQTPTYILTAAAVETQDDDYYDVDSDESDEEQDIDTSVSQDRSYKRQRMLGRVLAGNQISIRGLQMRRYDTFIYEGILDTYRVEYVASPLKNPATARVFAHFISATGPSLSVFERSPISSSVLFNEGAVPSSQQGLWTYILPMAALHHQGLLHAMLALASLHIARLQGASTTPSMQHYAWALRRIHAAVSNPKSRLKVTTIAASMLLGFYEVMTADHMKWNMHLAGAKQLFVETDFVNMTAELQRLKMERRIELQYKSGKKRRHSSEEPYSQADLLDQMPDVDERIVSLMFGTEVKYNTFGHLDASAINLPPALDLGKFEMLKDLYWWYCKQDVIQSIVSGNPLLMDFNRWANCPPRAPLGRGDAVYGSFDHLILLLGRIADFASRDRKRKLKQMQVNGGQWRPAAGMNIPRSPQPPPQAPPTPVSASHGYPLSSNFGVPLGAPPPMPEFYGMAPPPRANLQMPSSYSSFSRQMPPTPQEASRPSSLDLDLSRATQEALEEHARIRQALELFQRTLSGVHAFQPLASDSYHSTNTAFGPTYFYRTYDIGCLWALYNMAVIIAIRAHPHMPPAAHVAAGVAAAETKEYAMQIGRIVAGIVPGPDDQALNPSLGAALCESCMPSFFAAVQYQDPRQRFETVTRIFSIARRTGWASAELIANGCETAWVKAAAAGRGPPYTRIVRSHSTNSEDPRLNGSWERLDPRAAPVDGDDGDRRLVKTKKEARLNWAIGVMGVEEDVERMRLAD